MWRTFSYHEATSLVSFNSRRGAFIMDLPAQKLYVPLYERTNQRIFSQILLFIYYMADIENGFCLLSFASEQ